MPNVVNFAYICSKKISPQNQNMKISAVIITFNEERNIGRCLQSLEGVADEIVVVDSGSTDRTEQICREAKVRLIHQAWLGYAEQKNLGNSIAENDWILSLDADEALSEELRNSLLAWKRNPDTNFVYFVNRLTNYCGHWVRHCGWYPDQKIRFWNKKQGKWEGLIHENIAIQMPQKHLKGDILHYSYYTIHDHLKQLNHFTELMAQEAIEKGKKGSLLKIVFSPLVKFLKSYFLQLGFLDGYYGLVICLISAQATFIKYVKIKELGKKY